MYNNIYEQNKLHAQFESSMKQVLSLEARMSSQFVTCTIARYPFEMIL